MRGSIVLGGLGSIVLGGLDVGFHCFRGTR